MQFGGKRVSKKKKDLKARAWRNRSQGSFTSRSLRQAGSWKSHMKKKRFNFEVVTSKSQRWLHSWVMLQSFSHHVSELHVPEKQSGCSGTVEHLLLDGAHKKTPPWYIMSTRLSSLQPTDCHDHVLLVVTGKKVGEIRVYDMLLDQHSLKMHCSFIGSVLTRHWRSLLFSLTQSRVLQHNICPQLKYYQSD